MENGISWFVPCSCILPWLASSFSAPLPYFANVVFLLDGRGIREDACSPVDISGVAMISVTYLKRSPLKNASTVAGRLFPHTFFIFPISISSGIDQLSLYTHTAHFFPFSLASSRGYRLYAGNQKTLGCFLGRQTISSFPCFFFLFFFLTFLCVERNFCLL